MKFGTDPEFLIVDAEGKPVPAHKAGINGKDKKHSARDDDGGKFFRDGYMLEINVAPDACRQTLTFRVQRTLEAVQRFLAPKSYTLTTRPTVKINLTKDMAKAPLDVKEFGCEPSYCAHDLVTKVPPIDAMTHPYRYGGAHLHFSADIAEYSPFTLDHPCLNQPDQYPEIIKLFDQYIGLPLTCLMHRKGQYLRRRFYGQAGEYRPQVYGAYPASFGAPKGEVRRGLEYRTPGPELWNTVWLPSLIMDIGRSVIRRFPTLRKTLDKHRVAAVRHAIDTGENRWKLLKSFQFRSYDNKGLITPATWKYLALQFRKSALLGPIGVIEASQDVVRHGFSDWYQNERYGVPLLEDEW